MTAQELTMAHDVGKMQGDLAAIRDDIAEMKLDIKAQNGNVRKNTAWRLESQGERRIMAAVFGVVGSVFGSVVSALILASLMGVSCNLPATPTAPPESTETPAATEVVSTSTATASASPAPSATPSPTKPSVTLAPTYTPSATATPLATVEPSATIPPTPTQRVPEGCTFYPDENVTVCPEQPDGIPIPTAVSTSESDPVYEYTVQPGNTLWSIGRRCGVEWTEIARYNDMQEPYYVEIGQVIDVPGVEDCE